AALPYARGNLARPVDACDLDVRAIGEPRMRLEQRTDELDVVGVADDDRVWIADVHDGDLETGDPLARDDRRGAELGLVEPVPHAANLDDPRPHAHACAVVARSLHQPGARDARPVAGHLRVRSVRIHD